MGTEPIKYIAPTGSAGLIQIGSEELGMPYFSSSKAGIAKKIASKTDELVSKTVTLERSTDLLDSNTFTVEGNTDHDVAVRIFRQKSKQAVNYSLITEKWEGIITEVKENTFVARLYKKVSSDSKSLEIIEGEFDFDDVSKDDRHLIDKGIFFYWVLGKETKKGGTVSNSDYLIFRRMPTWKNFNINESTKIADDFHSFFSSADTEQSAGLE